jgi:uncharacterized membrane protein YhaH (DUF805 family)
MMLGAIKYGLGNLLNFNGRDARQTFWYYVLFVYVVVTAISMLAMIPMMVNMFSAIVDAAASGKPPEAANAVMVGFMGDLMRTSLWVGIGSGIAMLVLLAASLVRRLHDSGMPGWWALAPGAIQVVGLAMMPSQIDAVMEVVNTMDAAAMQNPTAMMQAKGMAGLIGWVAIGLVIWFGVRKSDPESNSYGDQPVRF